MGNAIREGEDEEIVRVMIKAAAAALLSRTASRERASPQLGGDPLATAQRILAARRRRAFVFGDRLNKLFGEPSYDMLLDLYVAQVTGNHLSVSTVCVGSGVAETTALRHLHRLEEEELVDDRRDPFDARRRYVELTPTALSLMDKYLRDL